ncbi:hypothetical protein BDQ17DRAFT_1432095 [Cyathus striatus]|nr:hypothetical protein BDQ17DRAFT_1432095 [Cyathus striatus]
MDKSENLVTVSSEDYAAFLAYRVATQQVETLTPASWGSSSKPRPKLRPVNPAPRCKNTSYIDVLPAPYRSIHSGMVANVVVPQVINPMEMSVGSGSEVSGHMARSGYEVEGSENVGKGKNKVQGNSGEPKEVQYYHKVPCMNCQEQNTKCYRLRESNRVIKGKCSLSTQGRNKAGVSSDPSGHSEHSDTHMGLPSVAPSHQSSRQSLKWAQIDNTDDKFIHPSSAVAGPSFPTSSANDSANLVSLSTSMNIVTSILSTMHLQNDTIIPLQREMITQLGNFVDANHQMVGELGGNAFCHQYQTTTALLSIPTPFSPSVNVKCRHHITTPHNSMPTSAICLVPSPLSFSAPSTILKYSTSSSPSLYTVPLCCSSMSSPLPCAASQCSPPPFVPLLNVLPPPFVLLLNILSPSLCAAMCPPLPSSPSGAVSLIEAISSIGGTRGHLDVKTASDKDKEDEAASNAANKEKSKVAMKKLQEMSISIVPPMQPKTAGASEISRTSEIAGTSEITGTSKITGNSEITGTSDVLATTPSQLSDSEDNNSGVEHASETEGITQDNNEKNEDDTEDKDGDSNDNDYDGDDDVEKREDMVLDENNSSLAQIEEEDVGTMDIDSTLVSDTVPTKEDLKGASRTTRGIFWGRAQGNNFRFADNMNESSSMVVNPQGFVYITVSDDSPKFNPTLLNTEAPPQAVPTTVNSCLKSVLDSVAKRMPIIKFQNRPIMNFDTEHDTWIIFGCFNDIESTDTIQWTSRINDLVLYLAAISVKETANFHLVRSVGSSFGSSTTTKSSEGASGSGVTDENLDIPDGLTKKQKLIISIYKVDKSLLGHKNWSIQMAWKIYQEVQQVKQLVDSSILHSSTRSGGLQVDFR